MKKITLLAGVLALSTVLVISEGAYAQDDAEMTTTTMNHDDDNDDDGMDMGWIGLLGLAGLLGLRGRKHVTHDHVTTPPRH